ncbi:MAG: CDP-diacylglycerol--serine O-phosphatidyltransferase [Tissierellaceae bacterium]
MIKLESRDSKKFYVIPNTITYMNMFLGTIAIFIGIADNMNNIKIASILILIAGITDKLDGYVARKFDSTSRFGKELDSLCDLVSFGMAPAILWWSMSRGGLGLVEIAASISFIGAGIFRLARFNITKDDGYIIGLPITIAGMIMAVKYIMDINFRYILIVSNVINYENCIMMIVLSIMMISEFKIKKPL